VKWTEYENDRARKDNRDGIEREGVAWSFGPKAGSRWAIPSGDDTRWVLVHLVRGTVVPAWYSLKEEK
jgi:hypothetical protein